MQLLIQSTGAAVIRRINFPKRLAARMTRGECQRSRLRPLLSEADEQDARQTVALVLCQLGIPDATRAAIERAERMAALCPLFKRSACERASYSAAARTLGLERWKACFRAVRSALRIDRRVREDATDFSTLPEVAVRVEHASEAECRRARLARRVRYARSLLHASLSADPSRKRVSTFHGHLSTLRAFAAIWGGKLAKRPLCEGDSEAALRVARHRFCAYLDKGEAALTAAAMNGISTARPRVCNERGELKAFAAL